MPRRLTHEQFMERFVKKNSNASNIEVLGQYKNNRTKIKCRCKIDGYEWEISPDNLLKGNSCPKCSGKMKKTHEEFIKELEEVNSDIEILGQYINSKTKIKVKCKNDRHIWEVTPNHLLRGIGCPKCGGKIKRTHEEFIKELEETNSNIEILGTYKNSKTKIKCRCKIDGHIWEATPNNLLNKNSNCPICGIKSRTKKHTKTHEDFIKELEKINSDIEVLEQYKGSHIKIKVKCKNDGHIWEVVPHSLLKEHNCPICGIKSRTEKQTKTHEEFIKELEKINSDIEVLGQYVNAMTKIKVKCKIDRNIWEVTPSSLLSGTGCPKCNSSKGEKRISKYLNSIDLKYIPQHTFKDCKYERVLPFDFYIPSLNMAIEFDGEQHFRPVEYFGGEEYFKVTQLRDSIKTKYCEKNNIKLIRIPYWDFDNIEEILKNSLI